jgi:hypothetical protein
MKPWMIDRIEQQRRENEWQPQALRIPVPPAGWEPREGEDEDDGRSVWTFQV